MHAGLSIPWFRLEPTTVRLPVADVELLVTPFGVTILAGLLTGFVVALLFAKQHGRSVDLTMNLALYLVIFAFPASYLLNGILYAPDKWAHVVRNPSQLLEVSLGWSMYGGILGNVIGAWVWKWRRGASILEIGDGFAFAGPFGWSIARFGCFVTHDHPGRISDFPLAVANYQVGSPPYQTRHDLGLYEFLLLVALALVFLFLNRKQRKKGFYVALLPLLYAPCRFFLDFLRAPYAEGGDLRYGGLTPAQYGSLALVLVGFVLMRRVLDDRATD